VLVAFPAKRVLVAARGIGRTIARAFAEREAAVLACDLLGEEVAPLAGAFEGGGRIETRAVDATDPASMSAAVAAVAGDRAIDVLVYVAGGVRGQSARPLEDVPVEDWRAVVEANLTGAFVSAQAVAPGMKRAGQGRIVTISSRAGLATSLTGIQSYAAAKHGQIGLVRQLAQELGPFGVTVNSVAPGFMATSPDYVRQWEGYSDEQKRAIEGRIAMRRPGRPEDIAYAVLFLASDYASWITGQVLPVTGAPLA